MVHAAARATEDPSIPLTISPGRPPLAGRPDGDELRQGLQRPVQASP
jgi:hypothetical protein